MRQTPFQSLHSQLTQHLPAEMLPFLPEKWEKIGDVLIVKLPKELHPFQTIIGECYAKTLKCSTVLNDVAGISGVFREPSVSIIYGSPNTETIHREHGIRFKLDPQKIMFSSGNMDERLRMSTIAQKNETVVDLFAGIGYFSIPMAMYSKPQKIYACEINPVAYQYLCHNTVLNHVTSVVEPLLGDNRIIAPRRCADRIVLGYLEHPEQFLPIAFQAVTSDGGMLHYHTTVPDDKIPQEPWSHLQHAAAMHHRSVTLQKVTKVKSYAPGISHVVLDVQMGGV